MLKLTTTLLSAALLLSPAMLSSAQAKTRAKKSPPTPLERPTLTPAALEQRSHEKLSDELLEEEIQLLEKLLELLEAKDGIQVAQKP